MLRKLLLVLLASTLLFTTSVAAQSTLEHLAKVRVRPSGTTTYADALQIYGGGRFGAGGAIQTINIDGTLNINSTTVPSAVVAKEMLAASGCSSGQILKYNGSAWACDTDIASSGGGGGTLSSISLVMPSAIFDISPGTLTSDGTFTVTFDNQNANLVLAGPATGSAAAPTFRSLVAADLPAAVTQTSDNEVITGSWRFNANTVFGDATTPQNLVHIYKGSAQAGISLEKGDETERWDFIAGASGLQIIEATGGLIPLTFKSNRIGIFNTNPTAGYEVDLTGDLKISGNFSLGSYFENSLIPATNDLYHLGDITRRWSQAWISQINAVIYAENTAQLFGGYSIIGKNAGKFTAQAANNATTIYLDKNSTSLPITSDAWIVIRAHDASGSTTPKTEYIKLVSMGTCTGSGGTLSCPWTVLRDQTNLHHASDCAAAASCPVWPDGTSYLFLGSNGDGRIEFYASSGLPRISILRQGTTANSSSDIVRLGGLDGVAGMSGLTGRYGIFIGEGTTNYMKFQKNVGGGASDASDDLLEVQGTIKAIAGQFGSNASNLVQVSSEGLDVGTGAVHGGKSSHASTTAGFWLGNDGGVYKLNLGNATRYLAWSGTGLSWAGTNTSLSEAGLFTASNAIITGTVVATAGYIGNWAIGTNTIADATGNVGLSSAVTGGDDVRFWAGDVFGGAPEFKVTEAGALTATSGVVGGWTLSPTRLSSGAFAAISGGKTAYPDASIDGFWLGWDNGTSRYVFALEGGGNSLNWDGTNLTVVGGNISGATIEGGTIQTSATGQRVVMSSTDVLQWYNSSGNQIGQLGGSGILIGDTSATSWSYYIPGSAYEIYSPDGSVGGLGKLGVYSTSVAGVDRKYINLLSVWDGTTTGAGNDGEAYAALTAVGAGWTGTRQPYSASFVSYGTPAGAGFTWDINNNGTALTIATANIGSFAFDTNVLYVDFGTNRVGINDSTPSYSLDVTGETRIAGQLVITGSVGNSTYFDASYGNTINFAIGSNANDAGWINYRGYAGGTTQFRDLYIGDGKGNVLVFVDGSAGTIDFNELTTTAPFYPFVSDNGVIRAKSDGVNTTVSCTAGSNIVFVVEYGIVTSITGSGCS